MLSSSSKASESMEAKVLHQRRSRKTKAAKAKRFRTSKNNNNMVGKSSLVVTLSFHHIFFSYVNHSSLL